MQSEYWQGIVDKRKALIVMLRRLWMVVVSTIVCAVLGIIIYLIYHSITDGIEYKAVTECYLDFAVDETGEVYQYYNGYTWNDLMSTDLIASNTLLGLAGTGVDLKAIEESTTAEILSDIRVLRITIINGDEELCERIQKSTEASLEALGDTAKEFNDISVIKSIAPERVYVDNRIFQAIELGAIVGVLLGILVVWFIAILDDRILVASDLEGMGAPVLGIMLRNPDGKMATFLQSIYENNMDTLMSNLSSEEKESIKKVDANSLIEKLSVSGEDISNDSSRIIIEIPYGKVHQSSLALLLDAMRQSGAEVCGFIITDGIAGFYRTYYSL